MDEPEQPRYRDIELRFDLHGPDGNVFVIIGKIAEAIEAVYGRRPAELFSQEALAASGSGPTGRLPLLRRDEMSDETKTTRATWHLTDTLTQPVTVLHETPTELQVRARQGVIWVPRSEVTYEAA